MFLELVLTTIGSVYYCYKTLHLLDDMIFPMLSFLVYGFLVGGEEEAIMTKKQNFFVTF